MPFSDSPSAAASRLRLPFHRAWIILGVLAVVQIVAQSISMSAGIMVAPLNDAEGGFGWSLTVIGAAITTYYLVGAVCSPLSGMLGDRFGARPLMLLCGAMFLGSMFLVGLVSQPWHFFLCFGVMLAVTQSLAIVPIMASAGGWFRRRFGLATGILWGSGGVGAALLAPVVASLLETVGWQWTFWLVGFVGGGLVVVLTLFYRSKPADAKLLPYGARNDDPPEAVRSKSQESLRLKVYTKQMRRTRAFWNLPVIHGLGCAGHGIILVFSVPLAYEQGISLSSGAIILSLISVFSIVGRVIAPILAERLGGKPVMVTALFVQGITVLVLFWAQDAWMFYLFGMLFGLGFGGEMSAYLVVNRQYFGSGPLATYYGIEIMGAMLGHAIATVLGGLVIEATGSYAPALIMSMCFSMVGVLVILNMESTRQVLIPHWEAELPLEARTTPPPATSAPRRRAPAEPEPQPAPSPGD